MAWVVGIDEAGYGPNLGPLVQSAVVTRLPDTDLPGWTTLAPLVRRASEKTKNRLLIDDSKKVNTGTKGFAKLEAGVLGALRLKWTTLNDFLLTVGLPNVVPDVCVEPWYDGERYLETTSILDASVDFRCCVNMLQASRFNQIIAASGSKATPLSDGLVELLRASWELCDASDEPIVVFCDKQGGRNFYAPMLQTAFPDGWILAENESADESRYRIECLPRLVTVVFRPRADGDSVCVALASMVCKYLREVCMDQFNIFWQKQVPNLKPTAGYPVDAKRFYAEIQAKMHELNIREEVVWRMK
jgi:hypothetical protein